NALKERFGTAENRSTNSGWATDVHGYDYWRSDFDVEGTYDYAKHEGLLYILDEMIKYSDEFRYEHCSGGGSLKDFSTLERMSFMTNEDTAMAINHRICLYAASYMINPVQLKADLNMTYNNKDFGAIRKDNPEHTYSTSPYVCTDESGNMMNVWEDPEYILYSLRSGFLGSTMVCFNEEGLTLNKDLITEQWKLYEEKQRPILRGANVYHILEQPSGIPWDWADWDGLMFYNDELDEGSVLLFRENDEVNGTKVPTEKTIKLKGLDKNATYNVTFEDRTNLSGKFTGAQLMEEGLFVNDMTKVHDSECIFIAKAAPEVPVEGITIEGNDSVVEGQSIQLTATVTPDNATDKSITWSIVSGEEFASVDQNGLVSAAAEGSVTVKVVSNANNDVFATFDITIKEDTVAPTVTVEITNIVYEPKKGDTGKYEVSVKPEGTTGKVVFASSAPSILKVNYDGSWEALAEGEARLSVSIGDVTKSYIIKVKDSTNSPTKPVDPDDSNKPIEPDNPNNNAIDQPKTGDASNIWLWGMLLVLATGAGVTVIYIRKKYSSKTK
ncbi:MAG: Ig-like domain-containing protein, partial [Lachnospiraceae bacterium]